MVTRALLLLILALFASPAQAAFFQGALHSDRCPYGTGAVDGCNGSNPNASYRDPSFLTDAAQSSQVYGNTGGNTGCPAGNANCHPNHSLAGMDYSVGYDTTLTLKVAGVDTLPTGCTYAPTGNHAGGPQVNCSGSTPVDFEGWSFTNCTELFVANMTAAVTVNNSHWDFSTCAASDEFVYFIDSNGNRSVGATSPTITITNTQFDGAYDAGTNDYLMGAGIRIGNSTSGLTPTTLIIRYCVFTGLGQGYPIYLVDDYLTATIEFNVITSYDLNSATTAHAVWVSTLSHAASNPSYLLHYGYNSFVLPAAYNGTPSITGGVTANGFVSTSGSVDIQNVEVIGNTLISNKKGGTVTPGGGVALLYSRGPAQIDSLTVTGNFVDKTGISNCFQTTGDPQAFTASVSGSAMTVTANASAQIHNGPHVTDGSSGIYSTVAGGGPAVTGSFTLGDSALDGHGSAAFKIPDVYVASQTVSGNVNMVGGTPIVISNSAPFTWTSTNCQGP